MAEIPPPGGHIPPVPSQGSPQAPSHVPPAGGMPPGSIPSGYVPPGYVPPGAIPPVYPTPMVHTTPPRRSIVGPLVLILIGLAFLLHRFLPEFHVGYLLRTYWPLLLIIWGVAKLFDNLSARRSGDTHRPFLTGGEVALLVIVLLFAGMAGAYEKIHQRFPDFDFAGGWENRSTPVTEDVPIQQVKPGAPVSISTPRGDITVFADEETDLRIVATKTVRADNEDDSRRRGRQVTISVNPVKGGYEVSPSVPSWGSHSRVDFEVHLPKAVNLTVQTGGGDIIANGIHGAITAMSQTGSLEIHDSKGDVSATVQKGDVRMTNIEGDVHLVGKGNDVEISGIQGNVAIDGDFIGSIEVDNVSDTTRFNSSRTDLTLLRLQGRLEMDSGSMQVSDALGNIKLNTRNRDVELDNVAGRIDVSDAHGNVAITLKKPPKDEVAVTNDSGAVDLAMPSNSTFEIAAASKSGEINSDFQGGSLDQTNADESSSLTGKVGARGPKITINTSYGTITLRKSDT